MVFSIVRSLIGSQAARKFVDVSKALFRTTTTFGYSTMDASPANIVSAQAYYDTMCVMEELDYKFDSNRRKNMRYVLGGPEADEDIVLPIVRFMFREDLFTGFGEFDHDLMLEIFSVSFHLHGNPKRFYHLYGAIVLEDYYFNFLKATRILSKQSIIVSDGDTIPLYMERPFCVNKGCVVSMFLKGHESTMGSTTCSDGKDDCNWTSDVLIERFFNLREPRELIAHEELDVPMEKVVVGGEYPEIALKLRKEKKVRKEKMVIDGVECEYDFGLPYGLYFKPNSDCYFKIHYAITSQSFMVCVEVRLFHSVDPHNDYDDEQGKLLFVWMSGKLSAHWHVFGESSCELDYYKITLLDSRWPDHPTADGVGNKICVNVGEPITLWRKKLVVPGLSSSNRLVFEAKFEIDEEDLALVGDAEVSIDGDVTKVFSCEIKGKNHYMTVELRHWY